MNVFLCRDPTRSLLATGFLGNQLILWGVALEILLIMIIDYTPWGNHFLGTSPIPGKVWLFVIPLAFVLLLLEETRKLLVRK